MTLSAAKNEQARGRTKRQRRLIVVVMNADHYSYLPVDVDLKLDDGWSDQ